MDIVTLSRAQFSLNICFHYLFPPMSIGLGLILVIMEACYLKTRNRIYEKLTKFWVSIFALIFAMGVATGLVMVFAFGNTFSNYSRFVGDVFGSILGAEGIFAFFMESGFLGLLLFGWNRVGPKMHFFSTIMVALGAHFSAIWIVIANSWMQTPAGHEVVGMPDDPHATIVSFKEVLFNPSSLDRLSHVIVACWMTGAFLVLSVSAFYMLKKRHKEYAEKSFKIALWVAGLSAILQLITADSSARGVAEHQPIKLAAFEGIYQTEAPSRMYLIGVVDSKNKQVWGIPLPGLLSFLVYHDFKTPVAGLDTVPEEMWPNVAVVFQTYHLMIFMWVLMVVAVVLALFALWKKSLYQARKTLIFIILSVAFPQIANQAGWCSAEMGRQPWTVQGLLKTKDAISPTVKPGQIVFSLVLYSLIYLLLFILFIYLLDKKIKGGPPQEIRGEEYRNQFIGVK